MIYIGNFVYLANQQATSEADRRHGEFNMMVRAADNESAVQMFQMTIQETRRKTEMFEGESRIYLIQLIEMDQFPESYPVLLNYKSIAGDPVMPYIRCTLPDMHQQYCRIFDWNNNRPEIDGMDQQLFISFDA